MSLQQISMSQNHCPGSRSDSVRCSRAPQPLNYGLGNARRDENLGLDDHAEGEGDVGSNSMQIKGSVEYRDQVAPVHWRAVRFTVTWAKASRLSPIFHNPGFSSQ